MTPRSPTRMIDANLNRASEALRTLEDSARFVLDRPDLSAELKAVRHDLVLCTRAAGWDTLLLTAHRDTARDTGTTFSTASETRRSSLASICEAAGGRAAQALRVLEELAKLTDPASASRIEQLRYRTYDLSSAVVQALGTGRATQWPLCVLITEAACSDLTWDRVAELACEGGASCLQLREPDLDDAELLQRAHRFVAICRAHSSAAFINNRPDVALLAGADGVHVGQSDLSISDVRKLAGARLLVGVSTSNLAQARQAAAAGADVCGVGPMFPSATKPKPTLAGIEYLREYLADPATAQVPHLAISGITPNNAALLAEAGCRGVAVCAPVCGSDRPDLVAQSLVRAILPSDSSLSPPVDSDHGSS